MRIFDAFLKVGRQHFLFLQGFQDGSFSLFQHFKLLFKLDDFTNLNFIQVSRQFFSVAGNKGNGASFVQKLHGVFDAFLRKFCVLKDVVMK